MAARKTTNTKIYKDGIGFAFAVAIAYFIVSSDAFQSFLLQLTPITFLAEIIAGGLYTSFLTIPISLSLLSVLAQESNLFFIAAIGGIGATLGDFILMNIFQKAERDIKIAKSKKWIHLRKKPLVKLLLTIVGVICLALPAPDEIAMGILGVTRINLKSFFLIVYPAKVLGLLVVLSSLQALQ